MRLWHGLLLAALGGILLPLDPYSALHAPVLAPAGWGYPLALSQQFYLFIKSAMLWVPLGVLMGFIGQERALKTWALAGAGAMLLLGLPLLTEFLVRDVLEVLFALPGLALGLWLGNRTRGRSPGAKRDLATLGKADALVPPLVPATRALPAEHPPGFEKAPPSDRQGMAGGEVHRQHRQRRTTRQGGRQGAFSAFTGPLGLVLGLGACAFALWGLADFPRWPVLLGLALVLYAGVLWVWPLAWLVVVPAALPLLDLAPWTGRFFVDEFDLLMLTTLGVLILKRPAPSGRGMPALALLLCGLFGLSLLVSLFIGLAPWPTLDENAFASPWSSFNALRVAKGFLWGGLFFLWIRHAPVERERVSKFLVLGMGLGLLGVGMVGALEHHMFVGFENRLETYRIVSTFSSMHTGGGHIEAYLVAALPFLWLATPKFRHLALTGPVMLLTAYVMLYTVARGGVLALGVVLAILLLASVRLALRSHGRRFVAPVAVLVGVGLVLAGGVGVGYFQQRFAETGRDWQIRVDHWGEALDMRDGTVGAQLFGMGLGSFPRIYQERGPVDRQPASFGFASAQGNTYFRLGTGETVYYAQRIPFSAGKPYRLEVDLRSRQGDTRLSTPVCEKQLLNSRQCEWFSFNVPGDGAWHRLTHTFSSTKVGAEGWLNRPPVELFLYQPGKGTVVDVDNIKLLGPDGRDVLCNGDFSRGSDCWFFKTHSHLPWHIKNVWVHVLFEQGWAGLLLFTALTVLALFRLARAGWQGHRLAWAWLASLAGLLTVGMFDSLLDAPRLATLLMAWTLLGAAHDWGSRSRGRHGSGRHHAEHA